MQPMKTTNEKEKETASKRKTGDKKSTLTTSTRLLDWDFSPFYENMIAMSNSDGRVCVATIPKYHDPQTPITKETVNLGIVHKDVAASLLQWHPCAKSILATAGNDRCVQIANIETGKVISSFEFKYGVKGEACSLAWNRNGTRMAMGTYDGQINSYDPRMVRKGDVYFQNDAAFNVKGKAVYVD